MKRILVTGGDGVLGRSIVQKLLAEGQLVRVMSRKAAPDALANNLEWAQADVISGTGVAEALQDVHTIVNCMSSPLADTYETDIAGTQRFLDQAKQSGVQYVLHISIIGIDRVMFPYYQYKLGSELVVAESGIPYTISRIAQFHYFVDYLISPLRDVTGDTVTIPVDVQFQPISPDDVATYLAPHIIKGQTTRRLPDFGGAAILTLKQLVQQWLEAQGIDKSIVPASDANHDLPFLNVFGDGFVKGYNTNPEQRVGDLSWQDYLIEQYGQPVK